MARAIISSILEAQLGKYVDGLRSDSLVVGLWSGELELRDLKLKPHALAELQLPVTIAYGSVSRVLVRVPWNQLGSASVVISLEGVSALVVPNTERPSPAELLQAKHNQLDRRELLRQHRRFASRVASDEKKEKQQTTKYEEDEGTFISRLTARIVANLQVKLFDVHLRYEDVIANPETPFACGLILKQFGFYTTDQEGKEAFVDHTIVHKGFTYKNATFTRLGVYWDRLSTKNARLETKDNVQKALRDMLKPEELDRRQWVLQPCSVAVHLTKNESTDYSTVAKYTIEAQISALQGHLTREQYQDGVFVRHAFIGRKAVEAHFILARGRPLHPPGARPREWWDYATRLVLERLHRNAKNEVIEKKKIVRTLHHRKMRWSSIHQAMLERQLYIEAFRTEIRHGAALDRSTREGKLKHRYEEIYPIDVIILLRDIAQDAEERRAATIQASCVQTEQKGGSWYSYFFGETESQASEEDNILSAEGRDNLREAYNDAVEKSNSAHEVPTGCNLLSIRFTLNEGTLALYQSSTQQTPFVTGIVHGFLAMNIQPESEWDAHICVQNFKILNGLACDTRFQSFCSPSTLSVDPNEACVSIDVSRRKLLYTTQTQDMDAEAIVKLRVSSLPFRVLIDPTFVFFLRAFFSSLLPDKELEKVWHFATSSVAEWMFANDTRYTDAVAEKEAQEAELIHSLEQAHDRLLYDVVVDLEAPVLILPECVGDMTGAVVVINLGKLSVRNEDKAVLLDSQFDTIQTKDDRLYWRVEVTQVFVSLGRQEQLVYWTDQELNAFRKIVQDLSIQLLLDTRSSSSPRLNFHSRMNNHRVDVRPHVGIYAEIPMIVVSLAEEQLVALSRIYSSLVTQSAKQKSIASVIHQHDEEISGETITESRTFNDDSITATLEVEKFVFELKLSLGCVELDLYESFDKEAFLLRASNSLFAFEMYSTHQKIHARLEALVMEDRLYLPDSSFFQLISTGRTGSKTPHLIVVNIVTYSRDTTVKRTVSQLDADVHFNVLHVQWNPSSMALLYRLLSSTASAFDIPGNVDTAQDLTSPSFQNQTPDSRIDAAPKKRVASLSTLRSRAHPIVVVRASLVQFSVTLNKDQQDRQLTRLEMTNSAIKYIQYEAKTGHDAYEVTGYVGNFIGTDLSTSKHPLYATLIGLDEDEARRFHSPREFKALASFEYVSDSIVSDKNRLCLSFLPIRGVYYHQQILELVDFILEGILGAIVSQTLRNATQLLLREDEASTVLHLNVEKPTLILPLSLQDAPHAKITADKLRLEHHPSSTVHYDGPPGARSKRVLHDQVPPYAIIRSQDSVSLRVDCKDLYLEQVRIYCTSQKQTSSNQGLTYEDLIPQPTNLKISIEDLVSSVISLDQSTNDLLPRFTVHSVLPSLEVQISRTSYLGIVALILKNFGADELQNSLPSSCESGRTSDKVASHRPIVTYTYLRPDSDQATLKVCFLIENIRILLFQDEMSSVPSASCSDGHTFQSHAFADVIATNFSTVFDDEYDKTPCLSINLSAFSARDLMGNYSDGGHCRTLMASSEPLEMQYTWNHAASTGELDLTLLKVTGSVCLEPLLRISDFFSLPTSSNQFETEDENESNKLLPYAAQSIQPSSSTRKESISDILRESKDTDLTMTIRVKAKQVSVALPRNAYDSQSPRVVFTGDFTLESVRRPQPIEKMNTSDLDIQSRVQFDALNMEIVLENARRPGCCVALPSGNGKYDAIDVAPLIQLLEPSSLHVEVIQLFPHEGQRQQIMSLKFTPIQVYVSYEDACMGVETIDTLSKSFEQHKQRIADLRRLSCDESSIYHSLTKSHTSSKEFTTQNLRETEIHRYITCELPSVSLTLINDCDGCDMGLVQFQIEQCHVFLNVTYAISRKETTKSKSAGLIAPDAFAITTTLSGGGNLLVLMSYYNPETRDWHPMCTEWALAASVQGLVASDNELHVILTASQALDLTITHGLLEMMASVGGAWKRQAELCEHAHESKDCDFEQRKSAPCVIRNETGLSLSFWLTNETFTTEPHVVDTGNLADVRYLHAPGRGRGVVRRYASGEREAANLRLCIQLMDSKNGVARFQAIRGLVFEELNTRTFPLVDIQGQRTSFMLSLSSRLVEGRILLVVSSPIKLVSRLTVGHAVALLVNDPTWHSPVKIGMLRSNQESAVPVLLSLASELRVRPVENGVTYAWSAPIPVQTRSAAELKVEAAVLHGSPSCHRTAVYCVLMSSRKDVRTVSFAEPLVLVNKLPVMVSFRVQSAYSSAYATNESLTEFQAIAVGATTSIWWTDVAQRPLFQLEVKGCTTPSKWLELAPRGTVNGAVKSVQLERVDDGRPFQLLVRVVGGTESPARPVRVELLANVWMINRSGLELVYGTTADNEAYLPPYAARAQVGNAQISAYSSDGNDKVPVLRIGLRGCNWSARFEADPKRLSWQDECLTLRSAGNNASSRGVLYELGVSADYATRHFGSVTTLVSVIPRYLIINRSSHTVLLLEAPTRRSQRLDDSRNENIAHHVLGSGDWYALYWVGGIRAPLRASVLPIDSALASFCADGYDWSSAFFVDQVGITNIVVPPRSSGRGVDLEITVKRGSFSQATFVVEIADTDPNLALSNVASANAIARTRSWQTLTLHAQVVGIILSVTDKKPGVKGGLEMEPIARTTFTRINLELTWSPRATAAKLNLMGLKVEDLLPQSKNRVVLRPLRQDESTDKSFLELTYLERPHGKYTWVERVHLELQDAKISTSMSFVDRLQKLQQRTSAHFQQKSLVAAFPSEQDAYIESEEEELLAYFVHFNDEGQSADLAAMTGRKLYIASGEISPVRVTVSFTRDKRDSSQHQGFWMSNIKLKIENACVTLEGYRLSRALATQESLCAAIVRFYEQSVKSQALNLIDSIQVTSLVSSMVTGGVTSLVSTLRGKVDPAAAAGALSPGLLTSSVDTDTSLGAPFRYEHLSNGDIVRKHSRALEVCSNNAEFLRQVRHLVYDWDANHTGLGARGCVALALVNNSRHSFVVNTQLNDGASLHMIPLGRRHLAGVLDTLTIDSGTVAVNGTNTWRADRALVVFAYGYTPTLLSSGDVYFTVQSNACNVYATRKTARLKANRGYTATFTLQEVQSWWAVNVVIIGDDLQANNSTTSDSDTRVEGVLTATAKNDLDDEKEYEVKFTSASLGLIAKQSGRMVIVRECVPSSAAEVSGRITAGDCIVSVNGINVANTSQFRYLVSRTPRPIVLRFRSTGRQSNAAYDLFGEAKENEAKLFG
ncbi:putative vacuolar protein sorting-associated protein [Plasmopara halstedii]